MTNAVQRKGDLLTPAQREKLIQEIMTYFAVEHDVTIGMIAAEEILEFFSLELGTNIYNKAIADAKNTAKQAFDNLDIDLDLLTTP